MNIHQLIKNKDIDGIKQFMRDNSLKLEGNKIVPENEQSKQNLNNKKNFYNQNQNIKKTRLNSLYGALLNAALRFYDERLGQSTTLSGRSITRHMNATVNETITGKYDYKGDAIFAVDTDSSYFSAYEYLKDKPEYHDFDWSRENIIELYDAIMETTNQTFPDFMMKTFHTTRERGAFIKAGRELVGSTALFIKKKKYAIMMYDKDGFRYDENGSPGKMKIMGLDMKRSDTPLFMQKFLEGVLKDILTDVPKEEIYPKVKEFREKFKERPSWEKGTPKKVQNLSVYFDKRKDARSIKTTSDKSHKGKVNTPGHVLASLNWNTLCEYYGDDYSQKIDDGARIVVCSLKKNSFNMTSIAYPMDEPHLPEWFMKLPFDDNLMEEVIIDMKMNNLVGVLNWDLTQTKYNAAEEFFSFTKK